VFLARFSSTGIPAVLDMEEDMFGHFIESAVRLRDLELEYAHKVMIVEPAD